MAFLTQGKQEVGLSPKHVTNAIMKRIKEDIIQGMLQEVMRARFVVNFDTHYLLLSALFYMSCVGTDFRLQYVRVACTKSFNSSNLCCFMQFL